MSTIKVNNIENRTGSSITIGGSSTTSLDLASTITGGTLTNTPAFLASLSSSQTISDTTETLVQFDTSDYDTDSAFSTSTYRFTVPSGKAGKYMIYFNVNFAGTGGGYTFGNYVRSEVYLKKNGSTISVSKIDPRSNTGFKFSISNSIALNLSVSDYIETYVWADVSAGSPLLETSSTQKLYFGGYRLIGA